MKRKDSEIICSGSSNNFSERLREVYSFHLGPWFMDLRGFGGMGVYQLPSLDIFGDSNIYI